MQGLCELHCVQRSGTAPLTSTLMSTDIMHATLFPLHFYILQAIKNWMWEQPGNDATVCDHTQTSQATPRFYVAAV